MKEVKEGNSNGLTRICHSDGMGTFLFAEKDEEDENFLLFTIEEEDEDNNYNNKIIGLHKNDVRELIKELNDMMR